MRQMYKCKIIKIQITLHTEDKIRQSSDKYDNVKSKEILIIKIF